MKPVPKPTRRIRVSGKADQKKDLLAHRRKQYLMAASRDGDWCTFCYFLKGKKVRAVDVHHVFGRGKSKESWREQYKVMLCTCRQCHPLPIYAGSGTSLKLGYVEDVLAKANATPINSRFQHEGK